jgi:hypothetical protein
MEKQRFYRAVSKQARFGDRDNAGKIFTMTFRNDNLRLAKDHAKHCFRTAPETRRLGVELDFVQFIGTTEPADMGKIVKVGA